jgi:hypothetical protein
MIPSLVLLKVTLLSFLFLEDLHLDVNLYQIKASFIRLFSDFFARWSCPSNCNSKSKMQSTLVFRFDAPFFAPRQSGADAGV